MASKRFREIDSQDDWELFWYVTATEMNEDKEATAAAKQERSRRKVVVTKEGHETRGLLPVMAA
jgi:hypothetical protein